MRDRFAELQSKGVATSQIVPDKDNYGRECGILAKTEEKGGLVSYYWTQDEFLMRTLGTEKNLLDFLHAF